MSNSNRTLQSTSNFMSQNADLVPFTGVGGYANEPFLTIANIALSSLLVHPHDWKFNRAEMPLLVTQSAKQDYLFAGATAFTLTGSTCGAQIDLASNNGITVAAGVVTVNTLEAHLFAVGETVYLNGVTMTTGTTSKYNSTKTATASSTTWSGGWVITAKTSTSFSFAATTGQNNSDVGGAPGVTDFGWASSASAVSMLDASAPQDVQTLTAYRELPVSGKVANPEKVAVIADLGTGVIKVRFFTVPGSTPWGASIVYQKMAPTKVALTDTWAPFPDSYVAVVNQAVRYGCSQYDSSFSNQNVEYEKLQQEINKAKAGDESEQTAVYVVPEEPIMSGDYWWGF